MSQYYSFLSHSLVDFRNLRSQAKKAPWLMWPSVASSITCRTSRRKGWSPSRQCLDAVFSMPFGKWDHSHDRFMTGWWWLEHGLIMTFHSVGNVMIPTDELTPSFFRGVGIPPTRWSLRRIFYEFSPCISGFSLFSTQKKQKVFHIWDLNFDRTKAKQRRQLGLQSCGERRSDVRRCAHWKLRFRSWVPGNPLTKLTG